MGLFAKQLREENIREQWITIIAGAEGKGEKFLSEVQRLIEAQAIPNVEIHREEVTPAHQGLRYRKRNVLVVKHSYFSFVDFVVSAQDFGHYLSVAWYMLEEKSILGKELERVEKKKNSFLKAGMSMTVGVHRLFAHVKDSVTGTITPENMDIFDHEELAGCVTAVHGAAKDVVKSIMSELDLDFTKVDTKSKGFYNLS